MVRAVEIIAGAAKCVVIAGLTVAANIDLAPAIVIFAIYGFLDGIEGIARVNAEDST